ncbi:MAG: hypothetical protein LBL61_06425 [Elusimicrobiota bacterium]|jgi:hypothetical protein|nr:hypothetical protein [Elusimicrobiota bacterium]
MKTFLNNIKQGLGDAKNMLSEGSYKPFAGPLILVVALWFGLGWLNDGAAHRVDEIRDKVEAQKAERNNEAEYKASKAAYESLVERLPSEDSKEMWLLSEMISIFSKNNITPARTGRHELEDSGIFTMASVNYEVDADFATLGKLVESVENAGSFLRISDLQVQRTDGNLGRLRANFKVNTIFVKNSESAGKK